MHCPKSAGSYPSPPNTKYLDTRLLQRRAIAGGQCLPAPVNSNRCACEGRCSSSPNSGSPPARPLHGRSRRARAALSCWESGTGESETRGCVLSPAPALTPSPLHIHPPTHPRPPARHPYRLPCLLAAGAWHCPPLIPRLRDETTRLDRLYIRLQLLREKREGIHTVVEIPETRAVLRSLAVSLLHHRRASRGGAWHSASGIGKSLVLVRSAGRSTRIGLINCPCRAFVASLDRARSPPRLLL